MDNGSNSPAISAVAVLPEHRQRYHWKQQYARRSAPFDDGTTLGVWIDPARGEPIWVGAIASEARDDDE
jgi:hypothetical protein